MESAGRPVRPTNQCRSNRWSLWIAHRQQPAASAWQTTRRKKGVVHGTTQRKPSRKKSSCGRRGVQPRRGLCARYHIHQVSPPNPYQPAVCQPSTVTRRAHAHVGCPPSARCHARPVLPNRSRVTASLPSTDRRSIPPGRNSDGFRSQLSGFLTRQPFRRRPAFRSPTRTANESPLPGREHRRISIRFLLRPHSQSAAFQSPDRSSIGHRWPNRRPQTFLR